MYRFPPPPRRAPLPRDPTSKLIARALRERLLLSFLYHEHFRVMQPYIYGASSRGTMLLSCFQVRGTSSEGKLWWKNCALDDIQRLELLDEHFAPRHDYNPLDPTFTKVFAQV